MWRRDVAPVALVATGEAHRQRVLGAPDRGIAVVRAVMAVVSSLRMFSIKRSTIVCPEILGQRTHGRRMRSAKVARSRDKTEQSPACLA
jgi:hypothetical protein